MRLRDRIWIRDENRNFHKNVSDNVEYLQGFVFYIHDVYYLYVYNVYFTSAWGYVYVYSKAWSSPKLCASLSTLRGFVPRGPVTVWNINIDLSQNPTAKYAWGWSIQFSFYYYYYHTCVFVWRSFVWCYVWYWWDDYC